MRGWRTACGLLCSVLLLGCGEAETRRPDSDADARPLVFAVNYPLAFFADYLGGGSVDVRFPVPAQVDPAYWAPAPEAVVEFQQADAILLNGAGYAGWVENVSLPQRVLVDAGAAFADELITVASGPVHAHGPQGEHSHGETAFTTWLDLSLAGEQARAVAGALSRLSPGLAAAVPGQLPGLEAALEKLDAELLTVGRTLDGAPVLFSHPVYQYLARRYALNGAALHWEPDVAADARAFEALDALLESHPARLMIWEGEPVQDTRRALEDRGIAVVVFEPLGNRPADGDFLTEMAASVSRLKAAVASR